MEYKFTVVVIPLKALFAQMEKTSRLTLGDSRVFHVEDFLGTRNAGGQLLTRQGIILAHVESVGSEQFRYVVNILTDRSKLARIIIDEAHVTALSSYRQCMQSVACLRHYCPGMGSLPIVLLTATAPPAIRLEILRCNGLDPERTRTIVGDLRRPNIAIRVLNLAGTNRSDLTRCCVVLLRQLIRRSHALSGVGRHLVVLPEREDVFLMIHEIRRSKSDVLKDMEIFAIDYHSGQDEAHRAKVLDLWLDEGVMKPQCDMVFVATAGFAVGLDAPDVRNVLVGGICRSLIDLSQHIGRAGRDGKRSEAVVLYHKELQLRRTVHPNLDATRRKRLDEFLSWASQNDRCRAVELYNFLGSNGRAVATPSDQYERCLLCDICTLQPRKYVSTEVTCLRSGKFRFRISTNPPLQRIVPNRTPSRPSCRQPNREAHVECDLSLIHI